METTSIEIFKFFENPRSSKSEKKGAYDFVSTHAPELLNYLFFPTSGSTGKSKWVVLSQNSLISSSLAVNRWISANPKDVFLQSLPSFHVGGYLIPLRASLCGAKCCIYEENWSKTLFLNTIKENNVSVCSLVPTQVFDLVRDKIESPSTLRVVFVGGGVLSKELYKAARKLKWPLLPTYGMTEASSQIATARIGSLEEDKYPNLYLLPHWQASVNLDSRLCLRGNALADGYLENNVDNKWDYQAFDMNKNREFVTEDRVDLLTDHVGTMIQFLERASDVVKISGELCNLQKLGSLIEELVSNMQLCQSFAVVDVSDQRLGRKIVIAYEEGISQHAAQELITVFNSKVMPFERIRDVFMVKELPKSALGKILKADLRKSLEKKANFILSPYTKKPSP